MSSGEVDLSRVAHAAKGHRESKGRESRCLSADFIFSTLGGFPSQTEKESIVSMHPSLAYRTLVLSPYAMEPDTASEPTDPGLAPLEL